MAEYRTVKVSFWQDEYVEDLEAHEKLLFIYFFTCTHVNNLGIFQISRKRIAFETGLNEAQVVQAIDKFEHDGKIITDDKIICVMNFIKNQTSTSPKILRHAQNVLKQVESDKIREALISRYPLLTADLNTQTKDNDTIPDDSDTISKKSDTISISHNNGIDTQGLKGKELKGKELKGNLKTDSCPEANASRPAPAEPPVIEMPVIGDKENPTEGISQREIDKWQELYPGVDVMQALRNMVGWLDANLAKRKTRSGLRRFITHWLSTEQNKAPVRNHFPSPQPAPNLQDLFSPEACEARRLHACGVN